MWSGFLLEFRLIGEFFHVNLELYPPHLELCHVHLELCPPHLEFYPVFQSY
jgi:hypothetical protein